MRHAATLVLVLAALLGAVALYRYESTRVVACGVVPVPVNANLGRYFARIYTAAQLHQLRGLRLTCQTRLDGAHGAAQGAYLAYAAFVAAIGGLMLARRHRRHP